MALDAVTDVGDVFLLVLAGHLLLVMAPKAGVTGVAAGVAGAAAARPAMVHGESVRAIKGSARPGGGVVAGAAVRAKHPLVDRRFRVAA